MAWPSPPDYNEAIQNPQHCFADPELRGGKPALNALGLPWPRSGNNADVYKIVAPNGKPWAVKCFTREVHGLHERYQAVSDHLQQTPLPFMVRFQYLEQGIRVQGQWYPVVKMRWVEGLTLNDFVKEFIDRPPVLDGMAQLWLKLAPEMRTAQIVHGDLQHGNVLMVPRRNLAKMRLRLIDYDGMIVPALAGRPSGELGHPNYQHPQRLREGAGDPAEADRFGHLVIYTALRCLVYGGRSLWERYENGDNLLFRAQDFQQPGNSALFHDLTEATDPAIAALAGHLLLASQGPVDRVPLLHEVAGTVTPLTAVQGDRVKALLAPASTASGSELAPDGATPAGNRAEDAATAPTLLSKVRGACADTIQRALAWGKESPPWSLRSVLAASISAAVLLGLAIAAGFLARSFTIAEQPSDVPAPPPPPARPLAASPQFKPLGDVRLQIGDNQVTVAVERNGYEGPLAVEVDKLPEGITTKRVVVLPLQDSAVLEVQAGIHAGLGAQPAELTMRLGDQVVHKQPLWLRVQKPAVAGVSYSPKELFLLAGERQTLRVTVQRQAYQGPIEVQLNGLPEGLSSRPALIPVQQETATLEVSTVANADTWTGRAELTARAGEYTLWNSPVKASVHRPGGLRLVAVASVSLKAGETRNVQVTFDRRGYTGPVDIRIDDLPAGITSKPVTAIGSEGIATLEVSAAPDIRDMEIKAKVTLSVGTQTFGMETFTIKVEKGPGKPVLKENVRFTSFDGVQLWGTWYRSTKGKEASCVLLLHHLGGRRVQPSLDALALRLQKEGYAVLSFDFRGHGDSTTVDERFWQHPGNKTGIRSGSDAAKDTIRLDDFNPEYYPVLANDIGAARTFLDTLNDQAKCNSSTVTLIGIQEGATLGALWLYSECCRHQVISIKPARLEKVPEGKQVAAAVWLNPSPTLAGKSVPVFDKSVPLVDWLVRAGRDHKVPMTFMYGERDGSAADLAKVFLKETAPGPTTKTVVPDSKLTGSALLDQNPEAETALLAYLEGILKERPATPWGFRDMERKIYYWAIPPGPTHVIAKQRNEKNMHLLPLASFGIR
jgi:hypothetical protein